MPRPVRAAALSLLAVAFSLSTASAQLLIDFNSTTQDGGPHPQDGWQSYDAAHEVAADFVAGRNYSAFGTNVTLAVTFPDTTDNRVQQMIDRGNQSDPGNPTSFDGNYVGTMLNLVTDWIGVDSRPGNGGNGTGGPTTIRFTLEGLPSGIYSYTSYHHDTEHMHSPFSWSVIDSAGFKTGAGQMTNSSTNTTTTLTATNPGPGNGPGVLPSTQNFTIISDGSPVVIDYWGVEGANVHESFVGINGFRLDVIPEPGAAGLIAGGLGWLALVRRRRRAS